MRPRRLHGSLVRWLRAGRGWLAPITLLASLAAPASAQRAALEGSSGSAAQAETAALGWARLPGAEGCATAIELGERVESILGRHVLVAASDAALSIEGRVEPTEGGFRATIGLSCRTGESDGERIFEHAGADCREATEALALIVALLIDPDASLEPEPTPEATPEAPLEPPLEPLPEARSEGLRFVADLGGALSLLTTPFAAPAGRAALHLVFPGLPGFPLALAVEGWLAPFSRAEGADGASMDLLLVAGGVGLCGMPRLGAGLDASLCVFADPGGAFVTAERGLVPDERERVLFFAELYAAFRVELWEALTAHLGVGLLVPARAEPWRAAGAVRWAPDPVGLLISLGLGFDVSLGG